jgi:hypothetical protein
VLAEGILNIPNMPQSGFDGNVSTILHEGMGTDSPHDYYYRFVGELYPTDLSEGKRW